MITVLEFANQNDALDLRQSLNQRYGIPIPGNTTQNWCEIFQNNGKFYIIKEYVPDDSDMSKAVLESIASLQETAI